MPCIIYRFSLLLWMELFFLDNVQQKRPLWPFYIFQVFWSVKYFKIQFKKSILKSKNSITSSAITVSQQTHHPSILIFEPNFWFPTAPLTGYSTCTTVTWHRLCSCSSQFGKITTSVSTKLKNGYLVSGN